MPQAEKPKKPHPDFPLTPHASKRWCKKIGRKMYYFGTWNDPDAALLEYLSIKDHLQAGIDPRRQVVPSCRTVGEITNLWLGQKQDNMNSGNLSPEAFRDYKHAGVFVIQGFGRHTPCSGLTPADFTRLRQIWITKYAPSRLNKLITCTRMLFTWGFKAEYLKQPVRFGPDFKGASKRLMREVKQQGEKKLFTAAEIKTLIEHAPPQLKAMIYLGINCGLGNTDISRIRPENLSGGTLVLPRAKTGIERRIPLWKETQEAIEAALPHVPKAKSPSEEGLVFRGVDGGPWTTFGNDKLARAFAYLLKRTGLYRERRTFYALRHTCQTIGDGAKDPVAVKTLMGHMDGSMSGEYRQEVSIEAVRAVTEHIRKWLIQSEAPQGSSLDLFAAFLRPRS